MHADAREGVALAVGSPGQGLGLVSVAETTREEVHHGVPGPPAGLEPREVS